MGSRHGTFVNGEKVVKHELQPKDKIDFGMADSYQASFLGEGATIEELVERVEAPAPTQAGSRELYHLGVLLEVARTLGTGLSLEDVLTAVVDAAIQVTRTERGVLLTAGRIARIADDCGARRATAALCVRINCGFAIVVKRVATDAAGTDRQRYGRRCRRHEPDRRASRGWSCTRSWRFRSTSCR